ncbi:hypothetical protein ABIA30_001988 [Mycobacterium sp. MAA66]
MAGSADRRSGTVGVMSDTADAAAARELLRDSFTRLIEHVDEVTDGLVDEVSWWRPSPDANSIAWLLWHSARCQDLQLCDIAGIEQVWTRDGWVDRFALDFPGPSDPGFDVAKDIGYGHSVEDVGKVRPPVDLLIGYYRAVHHVTLEYVATVTTDELARIVDRRWSPPVTASARLVSIVDDCAQHLGQAAYVRGIAAQR